MVVVFFFFEWGRWWVDWNLTGFGAEWLFLERFGMLSWRGNPVAWDSSELAFVLPHTDLVPPLPRTSRDYQGTKRIEVVVVEGRVTVRMMVAFGFQSYKRRHILLSMHLYYSLLWIDLE